jgi:hypothetical protein
LKGSKRTIKNNYINGMLGWVIIVYLSVILLFLLVWFFPGNDKWNYKSYKQYEKKIDNELQIVIDKMKINNTNYYESKITKRQVISYLKQGSKDLNKVHDSFKWRKGDEITKELFLIKKQIIIDYAQPYEQKAKALDNELIYNDTQETDYINTLIARYNIKDRLQKEKFNLLNYR